MFSPKNAVRALLGMGVVSGSLAILWLTKDEKLRNQIKLEILNVCGEIENEWYTPDGKMNFDGRDLTKNSGYNAWWKKNNKGKDGSGYVHDCKPPILEKYGVTDEWLSI